MAAETGTVHTVCQESGRFLVPLLVFILTLLGHSFASGIDSYSRDKSYFICRVTVMAVGWVSCHSAIMQVFSGQSFLLSL